MIGLGGCSSTANMSCTTLLPDYNKPQQDMHTSVSMMKDEFNSSDAGKLSPSDKNHSDVSGAPAEVATEEDSNICVDSRSSSPNTYVNGSGAASAGNTAANEGDANDDDTEENAPSSPGVPLRQPGANGMDTAAAATATATAPGSLAMNDYATMFARHRLAMLRGEPIPPETSKLLRGMLQDKEKMMEAHKAVARQVMGGTDDHSIMSKLLQPGAMEKQGGVGGGDRAKMSAGFDGDTESLHSRSLSPGDISDDSDVGGEDNDGKTSADKVRDDCSTTESTEDSLEAKRARVENIITNMRTSPTRNLSDNNNIGESRRQKRKQYTPQQHGDPRVECSSSKQIRLEPDHIKNQLHRMQQLSMMHNRNGHMDMFGKELPFSPFFGDAAKRLNPPEGVAPSPLERLDLFRRFPMAPYESNPFDPSNFLKQTNNNKPVRDHELNKQANSSETNNNNVNNDLTDLAKILKAEIANSVGNLVDTIVARYVTSHKQDEKSPSAKDSISESQKDRAQSKPREEQKPPTPDPSKPPRTKVTENKVLNPLIENNLKTFEELSRPHHPMFPPPYFPPINIPSMQPLYPNKEPEQTEALPLIVSTPKKKRTKVTDTRLSPRAARALLQENTHPGMEENKHSPIPHLPHPHPHLPPHPLLEHYQHPLIPVSLPTSVAIPNPILQHSDVLAMHSHATEHNMFSDMLHQHRHAAAAAAAAAHLPSRSPPMGDYSSPNSAHIPTSEGMYMKTDDSFDGQSMSDAQSNYNGLQTSTLTPMHLRKAKLMFFYVRYPSSAIIKVYFPDVRFNKNNTAQLVKWFSNFREFFYIQMEKYARQAIAEGTKNADELYVTTDSEIYRVLNLHYNRNNQIEVPENFRVVIQATLREFYHSLVAGKDSEQSWKKAIYKVIARMDDPIPEYFKSPNWMEQLSEL